MIDEIVTLQWDLDNCKDRLAKTTDEETIQALNRRIEWLSKTIQRLLST